MEERTKQHGTDGEILHRQYLDIEEVSAEIRERVRGKADQVKRQDSGPARGLTSLSGTEQLWREVLERGWLIGDLPATPPTLRGRLGRLLVQVVRRSTFWLIAQIQSFQRQLAVATVEQAKLLESMAERLLWSDGRIRELESSITELRARVLELERMQEPQRTVGVEERVPSSVPNKVGGS